MQVREQNLQMSNLDFIKKFSKITVKDACAKVGVKSCSNLWAGRVAEDKAEQVKNILITQFLQLIQDDLEK